ncbi:ribokinase [Novacetimonas maltaceti]|uniref:Ribokinase n=1 Tax=Novacetimonas maltaceti TaxID=1203393 RepID=A0A2S3VXY3_9PROT|nr:ribokinase [Novacetimonas maltaceti]POF61455.1 Ribokinase [Novacetimonas maltaceti]
MIPLPTGHIAVIGSINVDFVCHVSRFPHPGETLHVRTATTGLGGKGANQAVALARLGAPVELAGQMGDDALAQVARAAMTDAGVGLRFVQTGGGDGTGRAFITINDAGENQILVHGGANMALRPDDVPALARALDGARVVMMQMEIPPDIVVRLCDQARTQDMTIIIDPAPVPPDGLPDALFTLATVLTPNETETQALTGILPTDAATARTAAAVLHQRGVECAIIKMGARGVFHSRRDGTDGFIPPFAVTAVDSVAAGDCFGAGLARMLASGAPLGQAVRYAAACGALATTRPGAAQAAPTAGEVEALLDSQGHCP